MNILTLNSPLDFVIGEVLEDKLRDPLDALERNYRVLKSRAVKGYEKLKDAKCQLSNILHERKWFESSRLLKLGSILVSVLGIGLLINTVYTTDALTAVLSVFHFELSSYLHAHSSRTKAA